MPELPEVDTVANDLKKALIGGKFFKIQTSFAPAVWPSCKAFEKIKGREVQGIERRGKFICIFLGDFVMTVHLRMSGRLLLRAHDDELERFERTRIDFDKYSVRFSDQRKFGRVWLSTHADYEKDTGIFRLGVEPLGEDFTWEKFGKLFGSVRRGGTLKKRNTGRSVKAMLLDQSLIAGIGNIYADESCFLAGVRPDRAASSLNEAELARLYQGILESLHTAIRNRGTSMSDFRDAYGFSGTNQNTLKVYGRDGCECIQCGSVLLRVKHAGRGTVFCRVCQR